MHKDKDVALPVLSPTLAKLTGQPAPLYNELWRKIVKGEIRAKQVKGRWRADPSEVIEDLGMTVRNAD